MNAIPETCPRCRGWVWHRDRPCDCKLSAPPVADRDESLRALGQRMRAAREGKGISLDVLAARTGISKAGLWEIEKGRNEPRAFTLSRIAWALDVTMNFLVHGL